MSTNSATSFADPMDPKDYKDYKAKFADLLTDVGETIQAGFTLSPSAAAAALGFSIDNTTNPPATTDSDQNILFFPQVDVADQAGPAYDDDGIGLEIEITITTSAGRTFQRTFIITVKQL